MPSKFGFVSSMTLALTLLQTPSACAKPADETRDQLVAALKVYAQPVTNLATHVRYPSIVAIGALFAMCLLGKGHRPD